MDAQRPGGVTTAGDLDGRLRGAGLRSTRQRATVLGLLDTVDGHLSADELVGALADHGTALPRSTVFKVLDDLVGAGLVLRAELGPGAARFESAAATGPHHHFVCRVCGAIEDVAHEVLPVDTRRIVAEHEVHRIEIVLRGRCSACRSRDRSPGPQRPD